MSPESEPTPAASPPPIPETPAAATTPPVTAPAAPPAIEAAIAPPPPPLSAAARGESFWDRIKPILRPFTDAAWLHLQIWVPFLANPQLRARQIKYRARENRDGMEWVIALPKQCWQCGTKTGLKSRAYDKDVRTFEFAISIIGVTLGCFMLLVLIGLIFSTFRLFLLLAPLSLLVGAGVMFIKSWIERVELSMWTCDAHANEMRCPEIVIDDEMLVLHVANPELADAAIEELRAERSKGPRYVSPDEKKGPRPPTESISIDASAAPAAPIGTGYARKELPSISLDAPPELVDPMMQADAAAGHKIQFDEPIKFGESIKLDDKIKLDDDPPAPK